MPPCVYAYIEMTRQEATKTEIQFLKSLQFIMQLQNTLTNLRHPV